MDRNTRLQRMQEFNANVRSMNTRKGKSRSTALAPPSTELPKLSPGKQAPPSYVQQDQEQGAVDTETPQKETEAKEQHEAVAKGDKETGSKDFAKGKRATTTVSTETKKREDVKGNFAPYLGHLVNRTVKRKYYLKDTTWLPNSIMLERILFSTHAVLRPSDYLWKHHKNYLSIMVTLYYSVLFYIQILRVQSDIKKIDKADSTWYRAFTRLFPEEKLVICGPLEPFFSGLVAFKADDERFGMVFPRLPNFAQMFTKTADAATWTFNVDEFLTVPNVPALFQAITTFIHDEFDASNRDNYSRRHQILFGTGANHRNHLGLDLPATGSWYYASSMINRRHPDTRDMYSEAQDFWLNTELDGADFGRATTTNTEASFATIGHFLNLTGRGADRDKHGFSWFEEAINMAQVHSRFFEGVTNLSVMPTIGGLDVPIQWLVDTLDNADADLAPPNETCPNMFKDLRAKARIIIEETDSLDAQTSAIHMTNAKVCYGRAARLTDYPAIPRTRANGFWTEQSVQYEDGSFHDVIIGGVTDMQADFYVPGGL